jgi:hypothetical protein
LDSNPVKEAPPIAIDCHCLTLIATDSNPVKEAPLIVCDPSTMDIATQAVPQEQWFPVKAEGKTLQVCWTAACLRAQVHKGVSAA